MGAMGVVFADVDLSRHEDCAWCFDCKVCECMCWCDDDKAVPVDEAIRRTTRKVTVAEARGVRVDWPKFHSGRIFSQVANNQNRAKGDCGVAWWSAIMAAFDYHCAYCGKYTHRPVMDHVFAVSSGGKTDRNNLVPACRECNRSKSYSDVFDWLGPDRSEFFVARCFAATDRHNSSGLDPGKATRD
jgi:5-methylcytosine-specific restriction endonuclease McrA